MATGLAKGHELIREIESLVKEDIDLHQNYLRLLKLEKEAVTKLEAEKVQAYSAERGALSERIQAIQQGCTQIMNSIPELTRNEKRNLKLSEWVRRFAHAEDKPRILALLNELKQIVEDVQTHATEFSQIVGFANGVVAKTLSLMRSATDSVSNVYTSHGKVTTSYIPSGNTPPVRRQA